MEVEDYLEDWALQEDEIFLDYLNPSRRPRSVLVPEERPDHLMQWDDVEFHKRFRLTKSSVFHILRMIEPQLYSTNRNQCVSPLHQLLATLRFYATDSFYITIGDFMKLHNSTLCRIIKNVTFVIASLRPRFISLPKNRADVTKQRIKFYNIARFPRVIAAVDGTHVKIQSPGGDTAEIFRNRKGFFSLNVQAMCTADLIFQDVVARWPGSTHDSTIFSNSSAKYQFDNSAFGNSIVLGDSGYSLNNYLLTPFQEPQTRGQRLYNESHIRTRNTIERCFGVWKRRFPVLSIGLRCKLPLAQDIITATAVLHNIARTQNDPDPAVDPEILIPPQLNFEADIADIQENVNNTSTRNLIVDYFESLE